jgi:hypothetical protein
MPQCRPSTRTPSLAGDSRRNALAAVAALHPKGFLIGQGSTFSSIRFVQSLMSQLPCRRGKKPTSTPGNSQSLSLAIMGPQGGREG